MNAPSTLFRARLAAQPLLLPVNPKFIWFSLFVSWLFNLLPWGQVGGVPDLLALCLVFWAVHEPRHVGMLTAFAFGLLMDVHDAVRLGEHALSYTLMTFFAYLLHRRITWFPSWIQALHVFPMFFVSEFVVLLIRAWLESAWPGWWWVVTSVTTALLWPLVGWLLQAPQRRPPDPDDTRPI